MGERTRYKKEVRFIVVLIVRKRKDPSNYVYKIRDRNTGKYYNTKGYYKRVVFDKQGRVFKRSSDAMCSIGYKGDSLSDDAELELVAFKLTEDSAEPLERYGSYREYWDKYFKGQE